MDVKMVLKSLDKGLKNSLTLRVIQKPISLFVKYIHISRIMIVCIYIILLFIHIGHDMVLD